MTRDGSIETGSFGPPNPLALRLRKYLCLIADQATPVTYQALARALALSPPNTILQLTDALEYLMKEDAAAEHPLIAALVISKARGGLPAPGFFDVAMRIGRFDDDPSGAEAAAFYFAEFNAAVAFWGTSAKVTTPDV